MGRFEDSAITWGEESAPVTVEYWIDLLCPACRVYETQAADTVEKAVRDGKVKLVVHPVSILDQSSKPAGYSSRAAIALACAGDKENGYLYMKKLYEEQPAEGSAGLSNDELEGFAKDVGLGDDWKKCFTGSERAGVPAENTSRFDEKGFKGTPTVFVNDTEMTKGTLDELEQAIEAAA